MPVYRFRVDYLTRYSEYNPLLLFAQKYEFSSGESSPLRRCYANAIILIESGKGKLRLDDDLHELRAGSMIYISAGQLHQWFADQKDPMTHRCAYFDWKYVERKTFKYQRDYFVGPYKFNPELTAALPQLELRHIIKVNNIPLWISYFNALTPPPEMLADRNPWGQLKYNGAFQIFLEQYLSIAMNAEAVFDLRIKKILDQISQSSWLESKENLYEWAKQLGLGKSRFHELFKKDTGYTPNQYLMHLKFHAIQEDLSSTNLSITKISRKYGYATIHNFSKAFKLKTGMTPSEYRFKHRSP